MDVPNHRSSHAVPVPRGGGLAALAGVATAFVVNRPRMHLGTGIAAVSLVGVGYADDHKTASGGLSPQLRLGVQAFAGLAASRDSGALASLAASFTTLSVVNIVNFMDGINGITGLTSLVWGLNAACSELSDVAWIGAATAGAGLGFLPWNAPDAHLFLGDSGSYLLGGLMALGIIRTMVGQSAVRSLFLVASPLMPYVADASQAILCHRRQGVALTEAHRDHVYQKLVDHAGMSHARMATIHAAFACGCAAAWRSAPTSKALIMSTTIAALYTLLPALFCRDEHA